MASASHYRLVDVPDVVPVRYHAALKAQNILDTAVLYERIVTRRERRRLAAATGIPPRVLTAWARFIDLMQIEGVGPKMVRLLNACGIHTLRDFRHAEPKAVVARMRVVNRGGRYSEVLPDAALVRVWIERARAIRPRLE